MSCCNVKGYITSVDIQRGKVTASDDVGKIYNNVQLINPYGTTSIPKIAKDMCIMIMKSGSSNGAVYGMPFNAITQFQLENEGDYAVGSVEGKNKITFKVSGNTIENATTKEVNAEEYNINAKTSVNGEFSTNGTTNLGDAIANVLNESAVILDGEGRACTISSAGQTKVKA